MNSLQRWKQRELYPEFSGTIVRRNKGSEEYIASHLSESPTGQIRLMRGKAALYKIAQRFYIYWKTIKRFRERVREITARRRGRSLSQVIGELKQFMNGWWNYYGITESFNRLRPLPHWIRRRLRALVWKHWPPARRAYASERRTAKPVWVNS